MKIFKFLLLLASAGSAFGGTSSLCAKLESNFAILLQTFGTLMEGVLTFTNASVISYPYTGNSYIEVFLCNQNLTTYTLANATSQVSGVSMDYILGIFNGTISAPFITPLDCIEKLLVSYYSYLHNLTTIVIPELQTHVLVSPINETTPCSTVLQLHTLYFLHSIEIYNTGAELATSAASALSSFGLTHYFKEQVDLSRMCANSILPTSLVEFTHMNLSIINAFIADQTISVPPPLSCIKGLVTARIVNLNNTFDEIDNNINNPIQSSSSNCEPFYTDFKAFETLWLGYLDKLYYYSLNISVENPIFTPFFIADLFCEVNIMAMFAANATSTLSGVDSETIYNILKGTALPPFASPLNCIERELLDMSLKINLFINHIIPGLESLIVTSTSDTSTCNATYTSLSGYIGTLVTILNQKGYAVSEANSIFTPTNMGDLYLASFASILNCLPDLIGKYVGSALHADGTSVAAYFGGNRGTPLPYPFSCVNILIDIIDSLLNQALVNYATDSPTNLVAPKIPKYVVG